MTFQRIQVQKMRSRCNAEYLDFANLDGDIETLEQVFAAAGYRTAMLFGTRRAMVVQIGTDVWRVRVIDLTGEEDTAQMLPLTVDERAGAL